MTVANERKESPLGSFNQIDNSFVPRVSGALDINNFFSEENHKSDPTVTTSSIRENSLFQHNNIYTMTPVFDTG